MGLPTGRLHRFFYKTSTTFLATLTTILVSVYYATLKIEVVGEENLLLLKLKGQNFIVSVWHTFIEAAVFCLHSRDLIIYTDHPRTESYERSLNHFSREVGMKSVRALGFEILDASLEKQSTAILKFVKKIKTGNPALIALDGPDGPVYKAKAGAAYIAQKTKCRILPVGFSSSRFVTLLNWDDLAIPLPFSKVVMIIGEPIQLKDRLTGDELDEGARYLEKKLDALCHRANEVVLEERAG
jgi:lysophospholipid acyltransferase (LPLAT)-like uncharacterized protein